MEQEKTNTTNTTNITIQQAPSNGIGTAGFVLALIGLFLSWIPVLGWVIWFLGLLFSFVGLFKTPKGLSIAGLVISLIGLIVLLVVVGSLMAAL
ncbi:MAG: hypothetical protein RSB23_05910 [Alistipes sp.]